MCPPRFRTNKTMKKAAVAATFAVLVFVSHASVAVAAEDNLPDETAIPDRSVLTINDGEIPQNRR